MENISPVKPTLSKTSTKLTQTKTERPIFIIPILDKLLF